MDFSNLKYRGLEAEEKRAVLKEEDVLKAIEEELSAAGKRNKVEDRKTMYGDEIIFDYAGFLGDVQFPGGTAENMSLVLGSHDFIPGFEDKCVNRSAKEKFDVCVTFPEDYAAPMLAGKDAVFHCKIRSIWKEEPAVLDEDFVKKNSPCKTVEEYKEHVRGLLEKQLKNEARFEAREKLMKKMLDGVDVSVNKEVINAELDVMMAEFKDKLLLSGLSPENYYEHTGTSEAYIRAQMLEEAIYRVRLNLALEYIAKTEGITLLDEEVEEVIELAAKQYEMTVDEVKATIGDIGLEGFKQDLLRQKTENFVYDNAIIKIVD